MRTNKVTFTKAEQAERKAYAFELLRRHLEAGKTVYTHCNSVSSSGMARRIRCYIAIIDDDKPEIMDISYYVSQVCGYSMNDSGMLLRGCGMDMGFEVVYNLSAVLFSGQDRAGYVLEQRWI